MQDEAHELSLVDDFIREHYPMARDDAHKKAPDDGFESK